MITTYEFYEGKYYGDIIPVSDFPKYESRAEDDIHRITFGRLKYSTEYGDDVQKAVCALAEVSYQIDQAVKNTGVNADGTGKLVKSKSSGNESISYDIGSNMITAVLTDLKAQERLKYDTAARYLSGTGLLYAGV